MKIGFTGAGGTGKTTALALLKGRLDLPVLPSPARAVFARWGITEADQEQMGVEDKIKLQNEIYEARLNQEETIPHFISDRTLLDNFSYHLFRCYQGISDEDLATYRDRTVANLKTYDLVFYFPLLNNVESDGFRYSNLSYQTMIDSMVFSFLTKNNIPFLEVIDGDAPTKADWIYDRIQEKAVG